jgi:hypothetical protein
MLNYPVEALHPIFIDPYKLIFRGNAINSLMTEINSSGELYDVPDIHLNCCSRNNDQRFQIFFVGGDRGKKRCLFFASVSRNGDGFARKRGWADNEFFMGICPCLVSSFIKINHQCDGLPSYDRFKRHLVQIDLR